MDWRYNLFRQNWHSLLQQVTPSVSSLRKKLFPTRYWTAGIIASAIIVVSFTSVFSYSHRFIRYQEPEFLTFHELQELYKNPQPRGRLGIKLAKFQTTPIISNEAYYAGTRPPQRTNQRLGPYLTVASWNIEESLRMTDAIAIFSSRDQFLNLIDPGKAPQGSPLYTTLLRQQERLAGADIIVLQEMDVGVKRSGYINAPGELAKALKMNYAYGNEHLEVDPVLLGLEKIYYTDEKTVDQEQTDHYAADPARFKGAFGSAVLSRYPIKNAEVRQLKYVAYDWYEGEKLKPGFLEEARQVGSKTLFEASIMRQIKVDTQIYFRVDLEVPELPEKTLTIINIHLEIKCTPRERELQLEEILSYLEGIKHPVIMLGDFNSAAEDLSATSAKRVAVRTLKNPTTWLSAAVSYLLPQALIINTTRFVGNFTKNLQDPLSPDIAVIFPNPLHDLFKMIQNYRFKDGGAFDFRGDPKRSVNEKSGALANSNERDFKGFETTWRVPRPITVFGKYRLDWIFVKSLLKDPYDETGPYRLAPHFGETLEELNTSLKDPVSDHHPNVVDLPFKEPSILKQAN